LSTSRWKNACGSSPADRPTASASSATVLCAYSKYVPRAFTGRSVSASFTRLGIVKML
jgi:hypothetical protein